MHKMPKKSHRASDGTHVGQPRHHHLHGPKLQGLPAGLRALIARSDPSGTWWFGVRYDGGHGKEDVKKRTGIGTGCMVSILGSWGKERVADA